MNEGIAKIVADTPDRFVGLGSVPLQNAELAVRELDYAVKNLGLRGVEICTNVNGKDLTDPSLGLEKFFARAEELGILIFLHPLGYTQAERLTDHYFNNVIGNPLDSTVAVAHLIFDGVMARHPKLKVLVAHGGGYLAHYWARMDHAWRARPDTPHGDQAAAFELPGEVLLRHHHARPRDAAPAGRRASAPTTWCWAPTIRTTWATRIRWAWSRRSSACRGRNAT